MSYHGTYGGLVRENRDPLKMGRLKVYVPVVMGVAGPQSEEIRVDQLPWALPAGLPAGASAASGGIDWTPEVGDQVWVRFLDGEPEKPIWEWGTQTIQQAKDFKLHDYGTDKKPQRAGLTRYGHTIDFTSSSLIITTKNGYAVEIQNGATPGQGKITIKTQSGHKLTLDDASEILELLTAAGQSIQVDDASQSVKLMSNTDTDINVGEEFSVSAAKITLQAVGDTITIEGQSQLTLRVGTSSLDISASGFSFTG